MDMKPVIRLLNQMPPKPIDLVPYLGGITYGIRATRLAARKIISGEGIDCGPGRFAGTREYAKYAAFMTGLMGYHYAWHELIRTGLKYLAE